MARTAGLLFGLLTLPTVANAQSGPVTADSLAGLPLRGIGPALTPGRVGDIAVDPRNRDVWYIAVASGGLWKTTDKGTTWTPIFDTYGSYSIGCVTLDPKNPDVVWLGTGENQAQRSVGFGDGVYKSTDGGKSWTHAGLKASEHIAKILVDPRDSNVVFVASQGPLWAPGGDRGLYKTSDGGKTWAAVLTISENTGVTDVCLDPRDPDLLYASSYQRRRNVGQLVGGGPEAAIFKSTDGGKSWAKPTKGLPAGDVGRIALAVSPQKPDVVYAHVTAAGKQGGFFRSEDKGETWERRSSYAVVDPQYYGEIYPDPHEFDKVYAVDVSVQVTTDGGKTVRSAGWRVHSDNHAIVFDPGDPLHLLVGNDGGLYETKDGGKNFKRFTNMPTTQFYRIAVDNAAPFYNVYGGAQDNGSMGGPARSRSGAGVRTADWRSVGGADGMQPRADPTDPNIVYTMSQNGAIVRVDRKAGTSKPIRPRGTPARWNWDAPFAISPHDPKRLYLAGSRLFRSDDRGDTWKPVSPDLTRQLDPFKIEVMGKLWGPDAISRNLFTTPLSVASAFTESPAKEGLLYVGTDDGLVQVSEDGGNNWRKIDSFPGVPDQSYVSNLFASEKDADTVYVAFHNWQRGDFKPYLLRSRDRGKTWKNIAGSLPDRHGVWCVVEDAVTPDLLFAGTEFGLDVTFDGGTTWARVSGGPTIAFRDLEVQKREGDLVCGSFGRGIFILDDYFALRSLTNAAGSKEAVLLPVRKTWAIAEQSGARPAGEFIAPNPPAGALVTYFLRDAAKEKLVVGVADAEGKLLAEIPAPATAGIHRVNWDLKSGDRLAKPGRYSVVLTKKTMTGLSPVGIPQNFEVVSPEVPAGK
jgi:photosystem II stability/assembly factor-like uncharacterized protein